MDALPPHRPALTEADRQAALDRFQHLRPALEDGVPQGRLARHLGVTLRTLQRWIHRYRTQGMAGLVRKTRADAGHRRLPADLQHAIEGLALRTPPPTVATIHRLIGEVAPARSWPVPSYDCVHEIVRALDPALVTLAHEGTKAYGAQFDLVIRHEASAPNEVWQADHTPLDIWICDEKGAPQRPWLTVILDDFSRAIAGYALNLTAPSAHQTALALHQAIWRKSDAGWHVAGIPSTLYTDHGSDFTSQHLEYVAANLHMHLVFSLPGAPRGRGKIERFFGTINQRVLAALPGYTPPGTPPPVASTLTLTALDTALRQFIIEEYHQTPHRETGVAPQQRWDAGGFLPRLPDSLEQLDLLLLTVAKTRRVQRDGIHFARLRYSDPTLAAYVGEDVTIRYDPRDMAEIRVFHLDQFLCRAVCQEMAGQTVDIKEVVKARTERRRQLRRTLSAREEAVTSLLEAHQEEVAVPAHEQSSGDAPAGLKRYFNE